MVNPSRISRWSGVHLEHRRRVWEWRRETQPPRLATDYLRVLYLEQIGPLGFRQPSESSPFFISLPGFLRSKEKGGIGGKWLHFRLPFISEDRHL